jgi:hypothetical protein
MSDFSRYRCWDAATAAATLSTEAVSPSAAVFFATHAPLRIYRSLADGRRPDNRGTPVDEEEVRRDFLGRATASGILLMPVIGQSGTGKSHLVRWIKEKTPSTEQRQVIYLPKTRTSLKAVVKTLLAEVESSELAQLKADVDRMSAELDQEGLERRLLGHLHEAIAAAEPVPGGARVLAGPGKLAVLLLDPHVRSYLLRSGSLIPRLASSLLADRREGEPDRPLVFTADDLPLDILDVKLASDVARKMLMLIKSRPELQEAAVSMLNEQLPVAVTNAGNIGSGRLQNAMLEIRQEFARQGKEIVLLIEDFALIQGIQRDLLDAMIEVGERDGRTVLAPVRTLMAVTTGYYGRLVGTVLTRARAATPYVYDLDIPFDSGADGMAQATAFVGRYLNAARVGRNALDAAGVRSADDVPNHCDSCDYRDECHSTFGNSSAGHGIYPFNEAALRRAIHARPAEGDPTAFNPRAVIGEVIRNVLVEHSGAIASGEFPDRQFTAEYPTAEAERALSSTVRDALDDLDPVDPERRATFLEFWGDAPSQPINLAPVLHHAFDISLLALDDAERVLDEPASQVLPQQQSPLADDLPASMRRMVQHVEEWFARDRVLPQDTAGELRGIIRNAVVRRCLWNDPLMPEPTADTLTRAWRPWSPVVSIAGASAENRSGTADAPIKFRRSAANSVFFQGLLQAQVGKLSGGGAESVRRLSEIAGRHRDDLVHAVQRVQYTNEWDLVVGLRAALIGAALAGRAWPGMDEATLIDATLDEGHDWARADAALRTQPWLNALERHIAARPELVKGLRSGFGISRGVRGDVRMIDAARALPLLRSVSESWGWHTPDSELAPWVKPAVARFSEWDSLIDAQFEELAQQFGRLRSLLPRGTRPSDTIDAVKEALTAAIAVGHAPNDRERFQAMITKAGAQDWRVVDRLESDLIKASSHGQSQEQLRESRIAMAIRDRGTDLAVILDFLDEIDQWLAGALAAARMRGGGAGAAAVDRVQELLIEWAKATEEDEQ